MTLLDEFGISWSDASQLRAHQIEWLLAEKRRRDWHRDVERRRRG